MGPKRALGISTKAARGVNRDWTSRKHEYWQSIHGQRQAKGFLKRHYGKTAGELLNLSKNQLRLLTGHNHFKEHLLTMGLVDSTGLDRCKQAFEMALQVLCQALTVLRLRQPGHHFVKSGDFADISISKVLHFFKMQG